MFLVLKLTALCNTALREVKTSSVKNGAIPAELQVSSMTLAPHSLTGNLRNMNINDSADVKPVLKACFENLLFYIAVKSQ